MKYEELVTSRLIEVEEEDREADCGAWWRHDMPHTKLTVAAVVFVAVGAQGANAAVLSSHIMAAILYQHSSSVNSAVNHAIATFRCLRYRKFQGLTVCTVM